MRPRRPHLDMAGKDGEGGAGETVYCIGSIVVR